MTARQLLQKLQELPDSRLDREVIASLPNDQLPIMIKDAKELLSRYPDENKKFWVTNLSLSGIADGYAVHINVKHTKAF
jgi:hypothetical protein